MRVTRFHILVISLVLNNKGRERIISTKLLGTRGTTRNNQEILMKRIEVHTELTMLKCLQCTRPSPNAHAMFQRHLHQAQLFSVNFEKIIFFVLQHTVNDLS